YGKKHSYVRPTFEPPREAVPQQFRSGLPAPAAPQGEMRGPDLQGYVDKMVLKDFSPPAVVINAEMDVLQFRGKTGDYLEHAPGAANLNLLRMARETLVLDLRAAVTKAMKQNSRVRQTGNFRKNGHTHEVVIEIVPFQITPSSDRFFLVTFRPTGVITPADGGP